MRRGLLSLLLALTLAGLHPFPARAQTLVQVLDPKVVYQFGEQITFLGTVRSQIPVNQTQLFYQVEGIADTQSGIASVDSQGLASFTLDIAQQPVRAFSVIYYWFELKLQNGQVYRSPQTMFYYEDNRFTWSKRQTPPFQVHWYQGDTLFAQNVLDVAQLGLQRVETLLPLPAPELVDIYAYATAVDLRATLQNSGQSWVGAHTDPDLGVMVVSLPAGPEQRLEMERQIPHELMHIMLFQEFGPSYSKLPVWLNEGLASVAELYPNPDYLILLNSAEKKGSLLPIASLCSAFPRDASNAFLAYAEANSFTRYLEGQFGTTGIQKLIQSYVDGMECERGVQVALGSNLTQLERQWRQESLGENLYQTVLDHFLPWLVLLLAVLAMPLIMAIGALRKRPVRQVIDKSALGGKRGTS